LIVTAAEPRFTVSPDAPDAVTVLDELVDVIEPVPVAVNVTFVPDNGPASDIDEFVPVLISEIAPDDVRLLEPTVIPVPDDALSVKVTELGLFVTFDIVVFALSVINTAPAVFNDIVGAFVSMLAPDVPTVPVPVPVTNDNVPVAEILVAACSLIAPVPFVVNVTDVPVRLALTAIVPFVPAVNDNAPVAVIVLEAVMLPVTPALSVKLNIAPVDTPLPVIA